MSLLIDTKFDDIEDQVVLNLRLSDLGKGYSRTVCCFDADAPLLLMLF